MNRAIQRLTVELSCGTIIVEPAFNRAVFISSFSLESQTMTIDHLIAVLKDTARYKREQEIEAYHG